MRDRNGAELKPGDECEFTCRVKVVDPPYATGVWVTRGDWGTTFLAKPEQLTKVVPEWEWRERHDSLRNTIHTLKSNTRCQHVACVQAELQCDEIRWKMKSIFNHEARIYDTLEAAKAAALAACRSAAEGGKEQS